MFFKVFTNRIFLSVCLFSALAYFPSVGFSSPETKEYRNGEIIVRFSFSKDSQSNRLRGKSLSKTYKKFVDQLFSAAAISRRNKNSKPRFEPLHLALAEVSRDSGKNENELSAIFSGSESKKNFGFLRTLKIQVPLKTDIEALTENIKSLKLQSFRIVSVRPNYILNSDCDYSEFRIFGSATGLTEANVNAWPVACEVPADTAGAESETLHALINGAKQVKLGIYPASKVFDSSLIDFAKDSSASLIAQAKPEKAALSLPPQIFTKTPVPVPTSVPTSIFTPVLTRTPTPEGPNPTFPPQPTFFPTNTPVINNPQPTNRPQGTPTRKPNKKIKYFGITVLNGNKPVKKAKVTYIFVGGKTTGVTDKKGFVEKSFRTGTLVAASIKSGSRETSTDSYKLNEDKKITVKF